MQQERPDQFLLFQSTMTSNLGQRVTWMVSENRESRQGNTVQVRHHGTYPTPSNSKETKKVDILEIWVESRISNVEIHEFVLVTIK